MSYVNRIVALVSGIVLSILCAYVISFHFEIPIPANYYDKKYLPLPLAVINGLTLALPLFVLSFAGSWITLRWLARPQLTALYWMLGGVVTGLIIWGVYSDIGSYYSWLDMTVDMERKVRAGTIVDWGPKNRTIWDFFPGIGFLYIWNDPRILAVLSGVAATASMVLRSERIAVQVVPA